MLTIDNFEGIVGKGINGWHVYEAYELSNTYAFHIKASVIGWVVGNRMINDVTVALHRNREKWNGRYKLTTDYITLPISIMTEADTKDIKDINRFIYKLDNHIDSTFRI